MAGLIPLNDRLKAGIEKIVRAVFGPRIDFYATYPCVVKTQNADGSLDLQPDDPKVPGLQGIPIAYGIPGVTVQIAAGARVALAFLGGDPSKPRATVWDSASVSQTTFTLSGGGTLNLVTGAGCTINIGGATSTMINLGAALQLVARMADPVVAGPFAGSILVPTQTNVKA